VAWKALAPVGVKSLKTSSPSERRPDPQTNDRDPDIVCGQAGLTLRHQVGVLAVE
jgi:hypothetical protein